jgi:quercetin dioxygenase-like cupin family protein
MADQARKETDHEVSAGRQIILPANEPHAASATGRFKTVGLIPPVTYRSYPA